MANMNQVNGPEHRAEMLGKYDAQQGHARRVLGPYLYEYQDVYNKAYDKEKARRSAG